MNDFCCDYCNCMDYQKLIIKAKSKQAAYFIQGIIFLITRTLPRLCSSQIAYRNGNLNKCNFRSICLLCIQFQTGDSEVNGLATSLLMVSLKDESCEWLRSSGLFRSGLLGLFPLITVLSERMLSDSKYTYTCNKYTNQMFPCNKLQRNLF